MESNDGPEAARAVRAHRERVLAGVRVVVGCVLFAGVLFALVREWPDVRDAVSRISPLELVAAELFVLAGLAASAMTWRVSLEEVGFRATVPQSLKIYVLGQLAKYLPGSVWVLAAQMELAKRIGAQRARALAASIITIGFNVLTGLALGLFLVPTAIRQPVVSFVALAALLAVCAVVLSPRVLTRIVDLGLRLTGRPRLERQITWWGVVRATGWSIASWTSYGVAVWLLALGVGAPAARTLALSVTGTALAITLGTLVLIAPSGIGVRDAVIVAVLSSEVGGSTALGVALVARVVFTLGDLIAAIAVLPIRLHSDDSGGAAGPAG